MREENIKNKEELGDQLKGGFRRSFPFIINSASESWDGKKQYQRSVQ